ncbi:prostaglandin reductase 1-like [Leguminivora glycinivorella]|uniref:prostaglandin reductase 1-like n=1 Tax=Leguminivora glycinivorella TaxID=1035111 RepID=UPI0020106333|nr:prostaglandin reductase 1-like [Leguminivora glycinivorella]XP_047990882.1 prostaglandin reductase 1-like [Leguminivora glycinivorella]
MVLAKKYVVITPFVGEPKLENFITVEEEIRPLEKNEFLAEALYISVDPYQRVKLGNTFPCDMIGGQLARITESKNPDFPVGALVMGHFGWRTHTIVHPDNEKLCGQKPYMYKLPDFGGLPVELGLSMCGRVGNTAYFGFTEICKPVAGETVVVSGAAGAVGSHVGQIAKILGCKVIGIAGSDNKCAWLVNELGFDYAANYKTENIADYLKKNAPNGVDCYFDNVGGELSSTVVAHMNEFGRVAVCGAISIYNETDPMKRKGTFLQPYIVGKQLKIEGFQVNRFAERTAEGIRQNLQWVKEGKLKYKNHIYDGFESTVDAFIGLFKGDNTGKSIVKVN